MKHTPGFRESIANPVLSGLYDYWSALRSNLGRLPRRSEVDPLDLPREVLPGIIVLEEEPDGRFFCRLAGTRLRDSFGFEPTGWHLDEVMAPGPAAARAAIYRRTLDGRRAVFCRVRFSVPGREFVASDRVYVPALSDETGEPRIVIGAQRYLMASDVIGQPDEDGVYSIICDDTFA